MVRLGVELGQFALEVAADVPHDLFHAVQVRSGEHRMAVPGHENRACEDTMPASAYVLAPGRETQIYLVTCSSGTTTASTRRRASARRWPGRSAAPGSCSTTASASGRRRIAAGLPYVTDGELSARLTAAKAAPERAWLARRVRRDPPAVPGRPEHGVPELLRLRHRSAQGPEGRSRPGSSHAKTGGRRSGSPRMPGSRSCPAGGCACRRSGTWRCAGPVTCPRLRLASPSSRTRRAGTSPSFLVETGPAADAARFPAPDTGAEVGIDLGLTSFAVLSDGTVVRSPRFLRRAERKLRRLQKSLSRKADGEQ